MAKAFTFTAKYLDSLPTEDKQYRKAEALGFCVRVLPSGTKSFVYRFTFGGKKQEMGLGVYGVVTLAEAREKHQEAYRKLKRGIDPRHIEPAATPPENLTFKHFSDLYLADIKLRYTADGYKIHKDSLENDVLPYWKDKPIHDIGKRESIALLERVAARSHGQVNNVLRAARGVFKYAVDREFKEYNPMLGLASVVKAAVYIPRERSLSNAELKAIWPVLPAHVKLVLVTAQRPAYSELI